MIKERQVESYETTATQGKPVTFDALPEMISKLRSAPVREYMLITPEGTVFEGTADEQPTTCSRTC
jgi:hypothetical protein